MIMSNIAVDTNILIYIFDKTDSLKHLKSKIRLLESPKISSQIVSEFINVAKRVLGKTKKEIIEKCTEWLAFGELVNVTFETLKLASRLIEKYDFQIFDAIIVASALEANCDILYSEDMHHGLIVEGRMKIINPFFKDAN